MASRYDADAAADRLLDRLRGWFSAAPADPDAPVLTGTLGGVKPVELTEGDEEFEVTVELPGFSAADVRVTASADTLRVEGERGRRVGRDERSRFLRRERRSERVSRTVDLPGPVDPEGVFARLRDGVLTVTLPRAAPDEPVRVGIE